MKVPPEYLEQLEDGLTDDCDEEGQSAGGQRVEKRRGGALYRTCFSISTVTAGEGRFLV